MIQKKEITLEDLYAIINEYQENNKDRLKRKNVLVEISDEKIFELREQGLSYASIVDYFEKQGIKIASSTISDRCKKIYKEKGKEKPKAKLGRQSRNQELINKEIIRLGEQGVSIKRIILNLKHSKNATNEQLEELAKLYGIELNLEEFMEL